MYPHIMDSFPRPLANQIPNVNLLQSYLQSIVVRATVTYPDVKSNRLELLLVSFFPRIALSTAGAYKRDTRYTVTLPTLFVSAVQALCFIGGRGTTLARLHIINQRSDFPSSFSIFFLQEDQETPST